MSDEAMWSQLQKWSACDPAFREKLDAVCDDLRSLGFSPHMVYTWRSVKTQARLVATGKSRVSFSFHNAETAEHEPASLACDLIDKNLGWGSEARGFFDALGRIAMKHGLTWGGDWDGDGDRTDQSFNDLAHIQMYPNSALSWVKRATLGD